LSPEEQQLLHRLFESKHFAFADSLKRILNYICEHAYGADSQPIKEYEIAVSALHRPDSFDPKLDPVVRVSMASIRDRLRAYFETDGRNEAQVLAVPRGRYQAVFGPRADAATTPPRPSTEALRRFWAPYAAPAAGNVVTYTEPLFYRHDASMTYVRNIFVNEVADAAEADLRRRSPLVDATPLRPCYHYLSSGEMQGSISLARLFGELGFPLEMRNARLSSVNELRRTNLILLGSVRTNHLVDALGGSRGVRMTVDRLEDPDAPPGQPREYRGTDFLDGKLRRAREFVLVTRRPGLGAGTTITLIASHHGRACQGVGTMLTMEAEVASLLNAMALPRDAPLPPYFQLLLEAEMIDLDDEVVSTRFVSHRVLAD
jgi:hypothetical protein